MEKIDASQNVIGSPPKQSLVSRLSMGLVIAYWAAFAIFRSRLNINSFAWFGVFLCLCTAFWVIENRSSRPARTFYRLALFSITLALLFLGGSLANHSGTMMAVIGWAGTTLLATIWAIHFERTEPRP